jgi:hypothetical protein
VEDDVKNPFLVIRRRRPLVDWRDVERHMEKNAADFRKFRRYQATQTAALVLGLQLLVFSPLIAYFVAKWAGMAQPVFAAAGVVIVLGVAGLIILSVAAWQLWRREGWRRLLKDTMFLLVGAAVLFPFITSGGFFDQWFGLWWLFALPAALVLWLLLAFLGNPRAWCSPI